MKVVTVSTDTPEEIRAERHLHGIQADMLSDRTLVVTDARLSRLGPAGLTRSVFRGLSRWFRGCVEENRPRARTRSGRERAMLPEPGPPGAAAFGTA